MRFLLRSVQRVLRSSMGLHP